MSSFTLKVIGAKAILDRFRKASSNVKTDTSRNLLKAAALIQRTAKRKVSGPVLNVRTGQLRRSIIVRKRGSGVNTVVTVGPQVKYGGAHEFGAQIPARFPKRAKALRFEIGGRIIFAKRAAGFKLKARPFMRPSLQENLEAVTRLIGRAFKPIVT